MLQTKEVHEQEATQPQLTSSGLKEFEKAAKWLSQADFSHKVIIAGNHDLSLDRQYTLKHDTGWKVSGNNMEECRHLMQNIPGVTYLEHDSCMIDVAGRQLSVFGSPYTIDTGTQNWAFQYPPSQARDVWKDIPTSTCILVTHSPPMGILDESSHWSDGGCPALREAVRTVQPRLHIFGHHHEGRGAQMHDWCADGTNRITSWSDPGADNRKQSVLDLTRRQLDNEHSDRTSTAFVNASIMKKSWA